MADPQGQHTSKCVQQGLPDNAGQGNADGLEVEQLLIIGRAKVWEEE